MMNIVGLARLGAMILVASAPIAAEAGSCNPWPRTRCRTPCVETLAVAQPRRAPCRRQCLETPACDTIAWRERPYRSRCASRTTVVVPDVQYVDVEPRVEYVTPRVEYVAPRVEYVAPRVEYVAPPQQVYYAAYPMWTPAVAPYPSCVGCPVYMRYGEGPGGLPGFLGVNFFGW